MSDDTSPDQRPAWMQRPEGGGRFALMTIRTLALTFGRAPARFVLAFVALYFMIRRGPERRASAAFLGRVYGRPARRVEVWRHLFTFATVTLDRVFLLAESFRRFEIRSHGMEAIQRVFEMKRGALLIGAHFGSFDALRILALERPEIPVRPVIDLEQNPTVSLLLNSLNPALASSIINARQDGATTALAIHEALQQQALVTLLADRARPGNATVRVNLLGAAAQLPTAPWLLAAAVKVPIILCFGVYSGGRTYDLHFEMFSDGLSLPRRGRTEAVEQVVQRFADRLSHYARLAPYNWFNFFDVWE